MNFINKLSNFKDYFVLLISFFLIVFVSNILGFYGMLSKGYLFDNLFFAIIASLINNFVFVTIIGIIVFPIYYIIRLKNKSYAKLIFGILFSLFILIEISLIKYTQITLINLGGDLLGYSISDIKKTAGASNDYNLAFLWPFFVAPFLFLFTFNKLRKYINEKLTVLLFLVFCIIAFPLKYTISTISAKEYQNKFSFLISDITRVKLEQREGLVYKADPNKIYPLLNPIDNTADVLSPFLNESTIPPNIVIIIVEGLGRNFTGVDAEYKGFTPFLDSLQQKSLYWKNAVSITGRTFGVIPSTLGSLPLGDEGFLEIKETPTHLSLITALKELNYTTSFFTGSDSSFDRTINFLEYQGTDIVIDQKYFGDEYIKTEGNEDGFSWGYADGELYKKALSMLDKQHKPRLDVYLTVTNHEPFAFPGKEQYLRNLNTKINNSNYTTNQKNTIKNNPDIFASLMYVDNSLKDFFKNYKKREDYNNTIFLITGDHRLIPIPQKDNLSRFHVPLLIYSPLIKQPKQFESIVSHNDITPSLIAYLHSNFKFTDLRKTAWLSTGLDTVTSFRSTKEIPLMRYKGAINDFIYKDYFYSDNIVYKIDRSFNLTKISDPLIIDEVEKSFLAHKQLNHYLTKNNKIFPDSLMVFKVQKFEFTPDELKFVEKTFKDKDPDQQFMIARDFAFNEKRKEARLLCNYILNEFPNHSDARILKGRTLAWDGSYSEAETEFLKVIKKTPYYDDAYLALLDLYWWSEQEEKSLSLLKKEVLMNMINPEISFKLAKANFRMNKTKRAKVLMDSIIKKHPKNQEYREFRKSIN